MPVPHRALRRGARVGALAACLLSPTLSRAAEVHHVGDLSHVCGGVAEDAMNALKQMSPQFDLGFWMGEGPRGAYLADVPVRIEKQGKTVARFTAIGPLCHVKAPAGRHTLVGTHNQQERLPALVRRGRRRDAKPPAVTAAG